MKYLSYLMFVVLCFVGNSCDDDDNDDKKNNDDELKNTVDLNLVAEGFNSPVFLTEAPDNSGRLFVVDQTGQIYIIKNGQLMQQPFLDISDKIILGDPPDERGLLGLAFHPDYASNGRFFVYYGGPLQSGGTAGYDHTNYVAEYMVSSNADQADAGTGRIVLASDHPQANHNAGTLQFGSDGYLYISIGDGGGGNDNDVGHVADWYETNEGGNGQDITQNLLGNILRIDVNPTEGYAIPSDNPFVGKDGMDEIYAYGLRNPYRFCFAPDGQLICGDAGQELFEEVSVIEKGGNYGWNVKEGRHCFSTANPNAPPDDCPSEDDMDKSLTDPVIEFANSRNATDGLGNVVVGGVVYHGSAIAALSGKYIFGVLSQHADGMDGAVFAADRSGDDWKYDKLKISEMTNSELGKFVLGFGQDRQGEVFVLTSEGAGTSGKVYSFGLASSK